MRRPFRRTGRFPPLPIVSRPVAVVPTPRTTLAVATTPPALMLTVPAPVSPSDIVPAEFHNAEPTLTVAGPRVFPIDAFWSCRTPLPLSLAMFSVAGTVWKRLSGPTRRDVEVVDVSE